MTAGLQLPKPGELIGAKYTVEGLLGLGGMGAVYEATHRVTGKRFALKLLLPELTTREDVVKRFIREAQVAGRFQHPNVVEVYDIGEHGTSIFMVMELLRGESLALRLEREQRLPVAAACQLMLQCLDGVAAAHAAGIIHRDLKPANIFLCEARRGDSVAKVLDFGISKLNDLPGIPKATTTDTGTVMGTPFYMAPEQLRSLGVDHRVDIYALGVTLYQLLSGRQPYVADNYPDLVIKIWTETPPSLEVLVPGTPLELAEVVARAMARAADDRYASADAMARALEPFANGTFVSSPSKAVRVQASTPAARLHYQPPPPLPAAATRAPGLPAPGASTGRVDPPPSAAPVPRVDARVASRALSSDMPGAQSPPRSRRGASLETTLLTSTPLASESLASRRVREGSLFARPATRWVIAACVLAIAGYGIWRSLFRDTSVEVAGPLPAVSPQPSSGVPQPAAPSPAEPAVGVTQQTPSGIAPRVERVRMPLGEPVGEANSAPAAPEALAKHPPAAPTVPVPVPSSSVAAGRPAATLAAPGRPRANAVRVGDAVELSEPSRRAPQRPQPSAARPRSSEDAPEAEGAAEAVKPAPFQRPNPAIDRTQF